VKAYTSSNLAFLSALIGSGSPSALRFVAVDSSAADREAAGAFFFFFTIDVKSLTTTGAGSEVDDEFNSLSRACAANSGALVASDSLGEVFNSST